MPYVFPNRDRFPEDTAFSGDSQPAGKSDVALLGEASCLKGSTVSVRSRLGEVKIILEDLEDGFPKWEWVGLPQGLKPSSSACMIGTAEAVR